MKAKKNSLLPKQTVGEEVLLSVSGFGTIITFSSFTKRKDFLPLKKRFYLFIFRERGREGERGRERSMCGCLSHARYWGPGLQPRCVP